MICVITRLNNEYHILQEEEWNDYYDSYKTPSAMEWKYINVSSITYETLSISFSESTQRYLAHLWSGNDDN